MGLLVEREVKFLGQLLGEVERPFVAIIGGAKVSDKIGVLENLLGRVDQLLLRRRAWPTRSSRPRGGAGPLARRGRQARRWARAFLKKAEARDVDVLLPRDLVRPRRRRRRAGASCRRARARRSGGAGHRSRDGARLRRRDRAGANHPLERADGRVRVRAVRGRDAGDRRGAAAAREALSIVGGGDSVAAVQRAGVAGKITHISTGGGASLEFLEGEKLPGLAALES